MKSACGAPPASRSTPSWLARRSPVKPGDPVGGILPFDNTGDSEIYHSDARLIEPVVFLEEEVTRFDITVNQPRPMTRGRPSTGGGATCGQRGWARGRHPVRQVFAVQELHHQEVEPKLGIGPEVVHRYHVGMVKHGATDRPRHSSTTR